LADCSSAGGGSKRSRAVWLEFLAAPALMEVACEFADASGCLGDDYLTIPIKGNVSGVCDNYLQKMMLMLMIYSQHHRVAAEILSCKSLLTALSRL
jgi:hypothetical protein